MSAFACICTTKRIIERSLDRPEDSYTGMVTSFRGRDSSWTISKV